MFRKLLFMSATCVLTLQASAQDTLVLINGRSIAVQSVDLQEYRIAFRRIPKFFGIKIPLKKAKQEYRIAYRKFPKDAARKTPAAPNTPIANSGISKARLKTMSPERVFAFKYRDGTERIIYKPDSLDPLEFTQEQMRLFIMGEQDATKYYRNSMNKAIGFGLGAGSGFLGFYGIAGPPLYATIMGSFTPNLNKRLERQNELQNSKIILDRMTVPVLPVAPSSATQAESDSYQLAMKNYESDMQIYHSAEHRYKTALKNHPKNISFSDPKLLDRNEYREGYERKSRDRKIRNAMLSGLAGFIMIVVGLPIIY